LQKPDLDVSISCGSEKEVEIVTIVDALTRRQRSA
jgi:hypothetical protein